MFHFCRNSVFVILGLRIIFCWGIKIAIIGSGPSGLLLTERLTSSTILNWDANSVIDVYDSRDDPRRITNHKSFAIGITPRIWNACSVSEGLVEYLQDNGGSKITNTSFIRGWKKPPQRLPSFRIRYMTNQPMFSSALLNWIDSRKAPSFRGKLSFNFNSKCVHIDAQQGRVYSLTNEPDKVNIKDYDLIVGADGSLSVVRQAVMNQRGVSYEALDHAVRWKFVPVDMGSSYLNTSAFFDVDNVLGGWWNMYPTGRVHMVFFWRPIDSLQQLENANSFNTPEKAEQFLVRVLGKVPDNLTQVAKDLVSQKASGESIFKISQYHHQAGKVVLVGDAAHGMSTSLGQGMSASFEDVTELYKCLEEIEFDVTKLSSSLEKYSKARVPEGHAITDLNYVNVSRRKRPIKFIVESSLRKVARKLFLMDALIDPQTKFTSIAKDYQSWIDDGKKISKSHYEKFLGLSNNENKN